MIFSKRFDAKNRIVWRVNYPVILPVKKGVLWKRGPSELSWNGGKRGRPVDFHLRLKGAWEEVCELHDVGWSFFSKE